VYTPAETDFQHWAFIWQHQTKNATNKIFFIIIKKIYSIKIRKYFQKVSNVKFITKKMATIPDCHFIELTNQFKKIIL
jgi:hypothetical protein